MNGFDKTFIAGNVANEPLLRKTSGDRDVLFLNIAVGKDKVNDDGTRTHAVAFIPVGIFGTRATKLAALVQKGTCVCVEGHHTIRDKIKLSIIADDLQIIGSTALKQQTTEKQTAEDEQQPSNNDFGDIDPDDE